jgi:hypothetical protein
MTIPNIPPEIKKIYEEDAWKIFNICEEKKIVTV